MSEKEDNGESEQECPEPSTDAQVDAGVKEEDFPSLVMDPVVEQNPPEQAEDDPVNNSEPGGVPTSEHVPVIDEPIKKDTGMPPELDNAAKEPTLDSSAKESAPELNNAVEEHRLNNAAEEPTLDNAANETPSDNAAKETLFDNVAKEIASNEISEDPASENIAEDLVLNKILEEPTSNHICEETASNLITKEPASNHFADEPPSNQISKEPVSNHIAGEPASDQRSKEPALNHIAEEPASKNIPKDPTSHDIAENPSSNNIAEDLASNDVVEGPVSRNYPQDPLLDNVGTDSLDADADLINQQENVVDQDPPLDVNAGKEIELAETKVENGGGPKEQDTKATKFGDNFFVDSAMKEEREGDYPSHEDGHSQSFLFDYTEGEESGTEEDQAAFMKELENFHKDKSLEFKPPKFYGEGLNCLKLWRAVTRLGGYDQVTSCKLWRQVGESFRPPKTCTTVSWSFRIFYEKALLEYEKHKIRTGELQVPIASLPEPMALDHQVGGNQASGSGRARRDAAARAMQGWHSQRLLGNGEVGDPIIKDKSSVSLLKQNKHLKTVGLLKRKKASSMEHAAVKVARTKIAKPQTDTMVVDVGAPADWVKINVRRTKDCFEVYALVPGLLREEVHVQSDPAGRLVISGEPEQPDNPWGVTPFKKVVTLPSRIDPHQTSAVVTLHGQLFVRAPFEQSES